MLLTNVLSQSLQSLTVKPSNVQKYVENMSSQRYHLSAKQAYHTLQCVKNQVCFGTLSQKHMSQASRHCQAAKFFLKKISFVRSVYIPSRCLMITQQGLLLAPTHIPTQLMRADMCDSPWVPTRTDETLIRYILYVIGQGYPQTRVMLQKRTVA